ncbi:MAG: PEGA domain-containing protein [Candidatus Aminicenantes bacterium]|nr:PEGA domain-containing protein [Candidatus Aminicenantes bacterium]MBM3310163.1 PEGA domain-containing protein [Candidatus Aminicenantes bacterium]
MTIALIAALALAVSPAAMSGKPDGGRDGQVDVAAEIEAAIGRARDFIREGRRFEAALNELGPLVAKLFRLADPKRQLGLSAEVFLLKGLAHAGLEDDASARRELRNLFELGPDVAREATKYIFDDRILLLLKQAERESQGLSIDLTLGIISDPPGAVVRIDGREAGVTPMIYQSPKSVKVTLEVALTGYRPVREEVVVDQVEMRRDYVLEFVGLTLVARSRPAGAKVLLDGQETGLTTNGELTGIPLGRHQVKLVKDDYQDWETWIDSADGKSEFVLEAKLVGTGYVCEDVIIGSPEAPVRSPTAVAVDRDGNYVVIGSADRKLGVFDVVLKTLAWWNPGLVAEIGLVSPMGIAVDGRNRYLLTDAETHAVFVLNDPGSPPTRWGEFGSGDDQFNTPLGIAVDSEGLIYIADSGNGRVKKHGPDGAFLAAFAVPGNPRSVAVGLGGKMFVIVGRKILRLSPDGGLEAALEGEAEFKDPRGLSVDASGLVFVADAVRQSIVKMDANGTVVSTWGGEGLGPGQLAGPVGVAVDAQGRVVVVERDNNRIQVFSPGGGRIGAGEFPAVGNQPRPPAVRLDRERTPT